LQHLYPYQTAQCVEIQVYLPTYFSRVTRVRESKESGITPFGQIYVRSIYGMIVANFHCGHLFKTLRLRS
jgi:hypothetical protein